jgi:hypothetical protein
VRETTSKQEFKESKWEKLGVYSEKGDDQEEKRMSVENFWLVKNWSSFYHQAKGTRLEYISLNEFN